MSKCKDVAQTRHTVTPPKNEPLEMEKKMVVSFDVFLLRGLFRFYLYSRWCIS